MIASYKKLAWLTDIHLNFLSASEREVFYKTVSDTHSDAIVITGDIAESNNLHQILSEFSHATQKPIYFVLGNHDYYLSSVTDVREKIIELCKQNKKLIWLGKPEIIELDKKTLLMGQDGWADARYGNFDESPVELNDGQYIVELFQATITGRSVLKKQMQKLADEDAKTLARTLDQAIKPAHKKVIIATHVPPFSECHWNGKRKADNDYLPFYTSKATGDVITDAANKHSHIEFLVLCGHTHTRNIFQASKNLIVKTGDAKYSRPEVQEIIDT